MRRLPQLTVTAILGFYIFTFPFPGLADCVSCGPGGECQTAPQGNSANCECKIRSVNGVAICKPSGVCDPNDATSCDSNGFPQVIASKGRNVVMPFLSALSDRDPLLAGAVWAGLAEWNSGGSEVKGTMGRDGRSYTYRAQMKPLAEDAVSLAIEVRDDRGKVRQSFEGVVLEDGRSGHFLKVSGLHGQVPVYSWKAH
jgi:hypothetical protein